MTSSRKPPGRKARITRGFAMSLGTPTADRYLELVRRFPLRPIRDEEALDAATSMIDELLKLPELTAEEDDYLDVLGDLVEKYEAQAHLFPEAPACDVLRYLMDCRGLSEVALAKDLGMPTSDISEVLAGKRDLNQADIARLADYFGVSPEILL
jgi:HTH-type transcriptional regulator / antitoxin HigA